MFAIRSYVYWRLCSQVIGKEVIEKDEWSKLSEITVFELDNLVRAYNATEPTRNFWIEYK